MVNLMSWNNLIVEEVEQILKLYSDPLLRDKLGKEGKRRITKDFSWDKIAGERETLLFAGFRK